MKNKKKAAELEAEEVVEGGSEDEEAEVPELLETPERVVLQVGRSSWPGVPVQLRRELWLSCSLQQVRMFALSALAWHRPSCTHAVLQKCSPHNALGPLLLPLCTQAAQLEAYPMLLQQVSGTRRKHRPVSLPKGAS